MTEWRHRSRFALLWRIYMRLQSTCQMWWVRRYGKNCRRNKTAQESAGELVRERLDTLVPKPLYRLVYEPFRDLQKKLFGARRRRP